MWVGYNSFKGDNMSRASIVFLELLIAFVGLVTGGRNLYMALSHRNTYKLLKFFTQLYGKPALDVYNRLIMDGLLIILVTVMLIITLEVLRRKNKDKLPKTDTIFWVLILLLIAGVITYFII